MKLHGGQSGKAGEKTVVPTEAEVKQALSMLTGACFQRPP